jgi:hypothetical protein
MDNVRGCNIVVPTPYFPAQTSNVAGRENGDLNEALRSLEES